jgi:hypothetical protein
MGHGAARMATFSTSVFRPGLKNMKYSNLQTQYLNALDLMLNAEFSKADALLEMLGTAVPGDPRLVYGRALCLFMMGRPDEAKALCERLSMEFKDPRGQRLQDAFAAASQNDSASLPPAAESSADPTPAVRRRWWPLAAACAVLMLVSGCMWFAYPVLVRLQEQGGQLPSLSAEVPEAVPVVQDTPALQPSLATPSSAPVSPEPAAAAGSDGRPEEDAQSLAAHFKDMVQKLAAAASNGPSGYFSEAINKAAWKTRLEGLSLPELPQGPMASVVELQPYRSAQTLSNAKGDSVTLTNLNPLVGSWYVLEYAVGGKKQAFHLEVFPLAANQHQKPQLALYADGLALVLKKETQYFPLWPEAGREPGQTAPDSGNSQLNGAPVLSEVFKTMAAERTPVGLLCNNMVLVRQQRPGSTSRMELATDILRETRVGDWVVEALKPMLIRPPEAAESQAGIAPVPGGNNPDSPDDALVAPSFAKLAHKPKLLNIETEADGQSMSYGRWYKAVRHAGVYVSVLAPSAIDQTVLASYPDRVDPIGAPGTGSQEAGSVVYMLAIDLERYGFGYAIGAEHPGVGWSVKVKKAPGTDGPDGFGGRTPLATIGALPPYLVDTVAGAFVGGFKREHGVFSGGALSKVNNNSHFGFVENGVVLSRLNPGLATAIIAPDGTMDMRTWPENGDNDFRYILHARQNGVPIIEGIDANGVSIPGALVNRSGEGAWSGSANGRLLTIRAGMGIQEHDGHRFLLLGYFTGATPNAMARAYQAYHCRYAMSLDMNAPELCYTALYCRGEDGKITGAEYLVKEMSAANGGNHLRFLQTNDTRDCFYLFRR